MDDDITAGATAARILLEHLAAEFDYLESSLVERPVPQVDWMLKFEPQRGLQFPVVAHLQGDELCLGVGEAFWVEWFPTTAERTFTDFTEAMRGVLTGSARLVEHRRKERVVKAKLQQKENAKWTTIARWFTLRFPSFTRLNTRVLQNEPPLR